MLVRDAISEALIEAIRSFPAHRDVEHCGVHFEADPFGVYATCPRCGARIKLRSYSGTTEIEDVFDAVFGWMAQPGAADAAKRRQVALMEDGNGS